MPVQSAAKDNEPSSSSHDELADVDQRWWKKRWVKSVALILISLVVGRIVIGIVGAIDWAAVGSAFTMLQWWQVLPLLGLLVLRQIFNAVPLSRFVDGLSLPKAVQNDLSANLIATVAPPPSDVVLRVGMFRSWGINPVDGMAGVTLNMIVFYAVRFLAPVVGVLLIAIQGVERGQLLVGIGSAIIAAGVIVGLLLLMRSDALASWMGAAAAAVVKRVKSDIDSAQWSRAVVDFRARMAKTLRAGIFPAMAAMLVMVVVDGSLLFCALRFVGVGADQLTFIDVLGAFMMAYPLTILPLFGFGILDASLIATWTAIAGLEYEPAIVAGVIIWRVFTLGGPLLLGAGALSLWRRKPEAQTDADADADTETKPDSASLGS